MTDDLNQYITKWLRPQQGDVFGLPEYPEFESEMWDQPSGPQWSPTPLVESPRVVPPERRPRKSTPMAWDGGPGLRDGKHASRIKYLLRDDT